MRVRCISTIYADKWFTGDASAWLTIGREYTVLTLSATTLDGVKFRVLTDPGHLGLFSASLFEVTDSRLSARWRCAIDPGGAVRMEPASWFDVDWDNDPRAVPSQPGDQVDEVVAAETAAMLAEE